MAALLALPAGVLKFIEPEPMSGCWLWNGCLSKNGYAGINADGKRRHAHRYVYQLLVGAVPAGLDLDHLCRVRCCVNPDHLEPVTRKENLRRSPLMVGHPRTICQNGHERHAQNIYVLTRGNGKTERLCRQCCRDRQDRASKRRTN